MNEILFLDGCARGWEVSRTYALAEYLLDQYRLKNPKDDIAEVHLTEEHVCCFNPALLEQREKLLAVGALTDDAFALARQFANADKIVVAAPFWDMSFPALVKAYIENISVRGITFGYDKSGQPVGLCKGQKLLYVTTCGGCYDEQGDDANVMAYWRSLCRMFGIGQFDSLWVQGLDIVENDAEQIMEQARARAKEIAQSW